MKRFVFSNPKLNSLRDKPRASLDALIRVYDEAGRMIETHEHKGDFKDW